MKIETLEPLTTLAFIFAIIPKIPSKMDLIQKYKRGWSDYIHAGIALIAIILFTGWIMYGTFFVQDTQTHKTVTFLYTLTDIATTCCNLLAIALINIYHGNDLLTFLKRIKQLEMFSIPGGKPPTFMRNYLLLQLATLALLVADVGMVWVRSGWDMVKYQIIRNILVYHSVIIACILTQFGHLLYFRMKDLNEHLISLSTPKGSDSLFYSYYERKLTSGDVKRTNLRTISNAFTTITELVDTYGNLLGTNIVAFYAFDVLCLLNPLNMLLLRTRGIDIYNEDGNHSDLSLGMILLLLGWVAYCCVLGFTILHSCNDAAKEAGRVPQICYILIRDLPEDEFKLRTELQKYSSQAFKLHVGFTAGGFFSIDYSVTFPLLASILSYIIVLLQFH